ncbi:hypothetical protein [Isachenkonia alkalipeptolytica]|uniref:Uncharacterized protein n=1 Tax=Isachenkonia alkalipeptolytica TaxID=2565777 RepID=A0AA43XMQ3_9CLOT|nr:hypothetical protein [Isachenkonia alkalipeptolytica]NBG89545.1 hypothetical protein [Isachenkonia alkalipeptolytica]
MLLKYSRIKKKLKDSNWLKLRDLPEEDREMIKKVMKSLGIFRVNSFDAQLILKDLIGMSQEMELRDSSLKVEIGEDLTGYVNELVENSKGASPLEYITYFGKRVFLAMFMITLFIGFLFTDGSWRGPLPIILFFLGINIFGEIYHGIIVPNYNIEKGIRRRIPDLIFVIIAAPIIILTTPSAFAESVFKVNYQLLSGVFGMIYLGCKIGHLWAEKQLIEGREHLVEE